MEVGSHLSPVINPLPPHSDHCAQPLASPRLLEYARDFIPAILLARMSNLQISSWLTSHFIQVSPQGGCPWLPCVSLAPVALITAGYSLCFYFKSLFIVCLCHQNLSATIARIFPLVHRCTSAPRTVRSHYTCCHWGEREEGRKTVPGAW